MPVHDLIKHLNAKPPGFDEGDCNLEIIIRDPSGSGANRNHISGAQKGRYHQSIFDGPKERTTRCRTGTTVQKELNT